MQSFSFSVILHKTYLHVAHFNIEVKEMFEKAEEEKAKEEEELQK